MIKYLIWDFDGVLCDSLSLAIEAHNTILGINRTDESPTIRRDTYLRELDDILATDNTSKISSYYLEHRNLMYISRKNLHLFDDIIVFIENCTIPSIILTSTYEKLVIDVLSNNNVDAGVFSKIIGRETEGNKVQKIQDYLLMQHLNPNEVLAIGDSPSDMEFCDKTGIPFIAVTYGYYPLNRFEEERTVAIFDTPGQLAAGMNSILSYNNE